VADTLMGANLMQIGGRSKLAGQSRHVLFSFFSAISMSFFDYAIFNALMCV